MGEIILLINKLFMSYNIQTGKFSENVIKNEVTIRETLPEKLISNLENKKTSKKKENKNILLFFAADKKEIKNYFLKNINTIGPYKIETIVRGFLDKIKKKNTLIFFDLHKILFYITYSDKKIEANYIYNWSYYDFELIGSFLDKKHNKNLRKIFCYGNLDKQSLQPHIENYFGDQTITWQKILEKTPLPLGGRFWFSYPLNFANLYISKKLIYIMVCVFFILIIIIMIGAQFFFACSIGKFYL